MFYKIGKNLVLLLLIVACKMPNSSEKSLFEGDTTYEFAPKDSITPIIKLEKKAKQVQEVPKKWVKQIPTMALKIATNDTTGIIPKPKPKIKKEIASKIPKKVSVNYGIIGPTVTPQKVDVAWFMK